MAETTVFDGLTEQRSLTNRVITAVASVTGLDPVEVDPLYPKIDPDRLDNLFGPHRSEGGQPSGRVTFTHEGCEIVVHSNGRIEVTPYENPETEWSAIRVENPSATGD